MLPAQLNKIPIGWENKTTGTFTIVIPGLQHTCETDVVVLKTDFQGLQSLTMLLAANCVTVWQDWTPNCFLDMSFSLLFFSLNAEFSFF